jgi:hypothetical protein
LAYELLKSRTGDELFLMKGTLEALSLEVALDRCMQRRDGCSRLCWRGTAGLRRIRSGTLRDLQDFAKMHGVTTHEGSTASTLRAARIHALDPREALEVRQARGVPDGLLHNDA